MIQEFQVQVLASQPNKWRVAQRYSVKNGEYILVVAPENYPGKKYRGRYCYEHHVIYWKNKGILPNNDELIHHKNHDKQDNRIENLQLMSVVDHNKEHHEKKDPNTVCSNCGVPFRVAPYKLKREHNFCSRKCIGLFGFNRKHNPGNSSRN